MLRKRYLVLFLHAVILLVLGCSGAGSSSINPLDVSVESTAEKGAEANRVLWGMWDVYFDPNELTVTLEPVRNARGHFDVTEMLLPPNCNDCLEIKVNSFSTWSHILDADVRLRNPSPLTAYDVRGILFTDDAGHLLDNADAWTGLWDNPGGEDVNPFKAFAKGEDQREFGPGAEHTEKFLIKVPVPPQWLGITFAVDASWPGNCREPYAIENFHHTKLEHTVGSTAVVQVEVSDWQDDVEKVVLGASPITGDEFTELSNVDGDLWGAELSNNEGATPGEYECRLHASSLNPGGHLLYDVVTITVTGIPDNPEDVTPAYLNFSPSDIVVAGEYAYVAGLVNGLHIFDVSEPTNPMWVNHVELPHNAEHVCVEGDLAYVAGTGALLSIIDVAMPESAHIVNTVESPTAGIVYDMCVYEGYAYVGRWPELQIIGVDPPDAAELVCTIPAMGGFFGIVAEGDYAYAMEWQNGLHIIDISEPESANVVKIASLPEEPLTDIAIENGYAYVVGWGLGLKIFDIDPIESAGIVNSVSLPVMPSDIALREGIAYVAARGCGLQIIDVTSPESAEIITIYYPEMEPESIYLDGDNVYLGDLEQGFAVVDISNPENPEIISAVDSPGGLKGVAVEVDLAFVSGAYTDLQIIDVSLADSAYVINTLTLKDEYAGLDAVGHYVYVGQSYHGGLYVIDADPPDAANLVNAIDAGAATRGVVVEDGYAYLADYYFGLRIVELDTAVTGQLVKSVSTPEGHAVDVAVDEGYAYLANLEGGLYIIDIDPIDSACVVKRIETECRAYGVDAEDGYAYIACDWGNLLVVDVDPVDSASVVHEVDTPGYSFGVTVSYGYAYVADYWEGLQIVDINYPESAYIISSVDTPGRANDVAVSGGFAYVADDNGGLRIIKLWEG